MVRGLRSQKMPFNVIDLESGRLWLDPSKDAPFEYEFGPEAAAHAIILTNELGRKFQVRRVESSGVDWRARERERFLSGVYQVPEWFESAGLNPISDHFLHVSRNNPALVAYTLSADKGESDRQNSYPSRRVFETILSCVGQ
jgi:hypothetical protein